MNKNTNNIVTTKPNIQSTELETRIMAEHAEHAKEIGVSFEIGTLIIEPEIQERINNSIDPADAAFDIIFNLGYHAVGDAGASDMSLYAHNDAQLEMPAEQRGEILGLWGYDETDDNLEYITNFQANVTVIRREGSKFMAA